jgi:hypothetical protein
MATDGSVIFRSADGGCSWSTAYTLGAAVPQPQLIGAYYIATLAAAPALRGVNSRRVYALAAPAFGPSVAASLSVEPPDLVVRSDDAGASWQLVQPQPTADHPDAARCDGGSAGLVTVSPVSPDSLYVTCHVGESDGAVNSARRGGGTIVTFGSIDGGHSWLALPSPENSETLFQVLADPVQSRTVWRLANVTKPGTASLMIWRSQDGGMTWKGSPVPIPGTSETTPTLAAVGDGTRSSKVLVAATFGVFETRDALRWRTVTKAVSAYTLQRAFYSRGGAEVDIVLGTDDKCTGSARTLRLLRLRSGARPRIITPSDTRGVFFGWDPIPGAISQGSLGLTSYQSKSAAPCSLASPQPILRFQSR